MFQPDPSSSKEKTGQTFVSPKLPFPSLYMQDPAATLFVIRRPGDVLARLPAPDATTPFEREFGVSMALAALIVENSGIPFESPI